MNEHIAADCTVGHRGIIDTRLLRDSGNKTLHSLGGRKAYLAYKADITVAAGIERLGDIEQPPVWAAAPLPFKLRNLGRGKFAIVH